MNIIDDKVKIRVSAGGAWEGHVVYHAIHPRDKNIRNSSSNIDEVIQFCKTNSLEMDQNFVKVVENKLMYIQGEGYRVSPEHIEEYAAISSASKYLKDNFGEYYMTVDDL